MIPVSKLSHTVNIKLVFCPTYCLLQDLLNEKTLVVNRLIGKLYLLDNYSFNNRETDSCKHLKIDSKYSCTNFSYMNKKFSDFLLNGTEDLVTHLLDFYNTCNS